MIMHVNKCVTFIYTSLILLILLIIFPNISIVSDISNTISLHSAISVSTSIPLLL